MHPVSASALRVFDAAARLGGFKAAAEELGVSPTAVSHQMRRLEGQLGFALFVRRTRQIELTEAGARLAVATGEGFRRIYDVLDDLREADQRLTVTTTPAFAVFWLVPRINAFEAANPDIRVHVDTSTAVVDLGRDRRVDVAIRYGAGDYEGMACQPVARETFAAFGNPDVVEGLTSLSDATLIETRWQAPGLKAITWDAWLEAKGLDPGRFAERRWFDQEQHGIQATLARQGLLLVSTLLVDDMVARGWLRAYEPCTSVDGFHYTAVASPNHADTRKVRRFFAWLEAQAV